MSFEPSDSRERLDALFHLVVDVGEGELGAFAMHGLRDAPGDGAIGGDADDERAFAAQEIPCVPPAGLCRKADAARSAAATRISRGGRDVQLLARL